MEQSGRSRHEGPGFRMAAAQRYAAPARDRKCRTKRPARHGPTLRQPSARNKADLSRIHGTGAPSPQGWPHRAYSELLQAEVLPQQLANAVIDCMRAYGATTLGVVANVSRPRETGRDILGFISYGYARALLALDRIEEYLLFLYSHRYHDHTPGSWVAGEVAGITGDSALFCIPAQLTIPLLVRWMLVFEDADEDRLYLGRALPRSWVGSEKEISIEHAPTRWGRVSFSLKTNMTAKTAHASVTLEKQGAHEIYLRMRLPEGAHLLSARVNGQPANLAGKQKDTILIQAGNERTFEVEALLA